MSNPVPEENKRPIRSYVIRSGRLTDAQRKAIESHWAKYVVEFTKQTLDPAALFEKSQPLTVEIGFGMGDSLLEMAKNSPEINFLGIEVHQPGVGKLLNGIADNDLTNIKLICHDAREILESGLPDNCIDRLLLFFPDPWHKKRHNKRRLVQPEFINLLLTKLGSKAELHFATDWQAYAEHMMEVLEANSALENTQGKQCYWPEPDRPVTKFEKRGQRLGHGVWDLRFRTKN
ncbi:MAG: tRNA (guanine-N(7)-)-methyltransferase [Pseudohongiella sp.]|nr:MAG: tRNA (guanine-N(7)-)-methyltransferase [Pseudohongiella sp.]